MKAVWRDVLVEEGNLAHNVAALRKALGSSDAGSDQIETIPGKGYRFVAPVTAVRDSAQSGAFPAVESSRLEVPWGTRVDAARAAVASGSGGEPPARAHQGHVVGRRRELAELNAAVESARSGRGQVLCLTGEPGIGKSTLVELFLAAQQAWGRDCLVAVGRCSELLAGSDAYLPVLEALDSLLKGPSGSECGGLMKLVAPTWFLQLQPLWAAADPSFSSIAADAKAASRERMRRELLTFIEEVSNARPLVLFVDDLHWANASTVELLAYFSRKLATLRTLVVVAYRPEEIVRTRHPFLAVRHALEKQELYRELSLELLSRDDVEHYLSLELSQAHLDANLIDFVHRRTEGNPLFVTDLVKHLRDQGVLSERAGRWHLTRSMDAIGRELPESVRNMIARRIDQFNERELLVLAAASVQGHQFESHIVADVSDMDAADVEDELRRLDRVHGFVRFAQENGSRTRASPSLTHSRTFCISTPSWMRSLPAAGLR
jgi:predicted ATPase